MLLQELPLQTHTDVVGAVACCSGVIATAALDVVRFWSVSSGKKIGEWTKSGGVSAGRAPAAGNRVCCSNVCSVAMKSVALVTEAPADSSSVMFAAGDVAANVG